VCRFEDFLFRPMGLLIQCAITTWASHCYALPMTMVCYCIGNCQGGVVQCLGWNSNEHTH
jgi:hypothetical protein